MASGLRFARKLDWNLLKVFFEVVSSQGVTHAAQSLWKKQSTISLALKRLEEQVGVRLCHRGPAGFSLTDEGRVIFEYCQEIFGSINAIPDRLVNISQEVHGQLKINIISNFNCPIFDNAIANYVNKYRNVELNIIVSPWEAIPLAVLRNETNIGISPINNHYNELQYDFLCYEINKPYCGKSHELFGTIVETIADLSKYAFILTGSDEPEQILKFRLMHGLGKKTAAITAHLEEAKRLTLLGVGICFLPEPLVEADVRSGKLWPLSNTIGVCSICTYVITNTQTQKKLSQDLFIEEIKKSMAEIESS